MRLFRYEMQRAMTELWADRWFILAMVSGATIDEILRAVWR